MQCVSRDKQSIIKAGLSPVAMHGLQAVSAMACSPGAQYPPRLAVAMRANKRNARIMLYEVLVGPDAGSPFGSSALCVSQANIAETLSIKV